MDEEKNNKQGDGGRGTRGMYCEFHIILSKFYVNSE
jgi:hypothetical protein